MKKHMLALMGMTLALCSMTAAQEAGDRVVVPARNTTRARKVDVSLMSGSIVVKAYSGKDVIVETAGGARTSSSNVSSNGMHRIDLPVRGLLVEEEDNQITVRSRSTHS